LILAINREVGTPPAATHRHQKLSRVLVALGLRLDVAEPRLKILALRIDQRENAGAAAGITDALQFQRFRGFVQGLLLGGEKLLVVGKRLHGVGNLAEGLQYRLLIAGGRGFER